MRHLLTFVILSFACYRITRLAILDAIFDKPRDEIHAWLLNGNDPAKWRKSHLRYWAYTWVPIGVLAFAGGTWIADHRTIGVTHYVAAALWLLAMYLLFSDGPTWVGMKIEEMISCPYCLSIWVGAGLQLLTWPHRSIPLPAFYFLALSGAGMVVYQYIDFEPEEDE